MSAADLPQAPEAGRAAQTPAGPSLTRRIASGAAWMVSMRLVNRLIGVASTLFLARLLMPEDFGLVALAASFANLLAVLCELSLDKVLIQKQDRALRAHYDTAFTMNLLVMSFAAAVVFFGAGAAARFLGEPRLESILHWLALMPLMTGLINIGTVDFRKHLDLDKEFLFRFIPRVIGLVIAVSAALMLRSYWALVIASLSRHAALLFLSYAMHSFRPRLTLCEWHDLFAFSKWLAGYNVIFAAVQRADALIVGKFAGATSLGFYVVAREVANLPSSEMAAPLQQVLFPGYAKLAHDKARLRAGFLHSLGGVLALALPASIGIGLLAEPFVHVLLGQRWLEAVPMIHVLVAFGLLRVARVGVPSLLFAFGEARIAMVLALIHLSVLVGALAMLTPRYGAIGGCWALVLTEALSLVVYGTVAGRRLSFGPGALWAVLWRPVLACLIMSLGVMLLPASEHGSLHALMLLLLGAGLGVALYGLSLLGLWQLSGRPQGVETRLIGLLGPGLARWRHA
ncbi:MAG: lipopolysaccharide biosynthesis protein [Geminicoccaceae bacterium]